MFVVTDTWKKAWPQATVGAMLLSGVNPSALKKGQTKTKEELQSELKQRFTQASHEEINGLQAVQAYTAYYKRFALTFDVRSRLEATLPNDKPRTALNPIFEAALQSSLESMIPTTCHDRDMVHKPLFLQTAAIDQRFTPLHGKEQVLSVGDMLIADSRGIIASALCGSDYHSRIRSDTRRVLVLSFGPPGIPKTLLCRHLFALHSRIRLLIPGVEINYFQLL